MLPSFCDFSLLTLGLVIPLMLVQRVLPFTRVYVYLALPIAFGMTAAFSLLENMKKNSFAYLSRALFGVLIIWALASKEYQIAKVTGPEESVYRALTEVSDIGGVLEYLPGGYVAEEYTEYVRLLKGVTEMPHVNDQSPELVILTAVETQKGFEDVSVFDSLCYEEIPWEYIRRETKVIWEDEYIVVYRKQMY